ncbi:MAG: metallophosphoesterase [Dysgonomonas sp.]
MRVFINAILVHTFLNIYVFWKGWKAIPPKKSFRIPFVALFVAELIIYIVGFVYVDELSDEILIPIMRLGTAWMVFILYMTMMLLLYDVVKFIGRWIKRIRECNLGSVYKKRIYFLASVLIVGIIMLHGHYRFWHPVVTEKNLTINKTSPLKNLKVAMVADVHVGYLIDKDILSMYVDKIMEQKPDVILLVGDIIDYNLDPVEKQHMEEEFRRLNAPYGVYAVTGNHEYRLNAEEKIKWLSQKAGLTVLRDSVVKVADAFYIVGREDDKFQGRKELSELMSNVDKNYPVIVMNHEPHRLYEESDAGADLVVFGHTHNGQLFPYNILINLIYEVGHGYKKKENTHIYVTSGLGLSGPQYRIGTISEIVVLNLNFE